MVDILCVMLWFVNLENVDNFCRLVLMVYLYGGSILFILFVLFFCVKNINILYFLVLCVCLFIELEFFFSNLLYIL